MSNYSRSSYLLPTKLKNKNNYEGDYDQITKKRNGNGIFLYKNKYFQYEGDWVQNIKDGKGTLFFKEGGYYEGDFKKGEITGKGKREWNDGRKYLGHFEEGEKEGYGEYFGLYDEHYVGYWSKNQMHGKGTYKDVNGNTIIGFFKNHKPDGICKIEYKDGSIYEGNMKNGKKRGNIKNPEENIEYEGEFYNDEKNGDGKFKDLKIKYEYDGEWILGKRSLIPNKMLLMFPEQNMKEQEKLFDDAKNDKKNKKSTDDQEKFKFVFPETLDYEIGSKVPLQTFEVHFFYQGPDIEDKNQPTKEEKDELIKQYQKEKKSKNPLPMPDFTKKKMIPSPPVLIDCESGRKVKFQLVKYDDPTKKETFTIYKFDYREEIKAKRQDLLEKQKILEEEEAKNALVLEAQNNNQKKSPNKAKKEIKKKDDSKTEADLNKIDLYKEKEQDSNKDLNELSKKGKIIIENIEFPDNFPPGTYTLNISEVTRNYNANLSPVSFDINILPLGGGDEKKKQRKK